MRELRLLCTAIVLWTVCAGTVSVASDGFRTTARVAGDGLHIAWREHRIDDQGLSGVALRGADGLAVADLDGDGHQDVVSVHEDSGHVRIAFGTEDPDRWERHTLASGASVAGCEDVDIADMNGDGRPDVVVAAESGRLVYFRSPAKPRDIASWSSTELAATLGRGSWIRVEIADLDGDGRLDLLATNKAAPEKRGTYSWFRLEGEADDPRAWKERVIGEAVFPINARAVDLDGDEDLDVVAGSWGEEAIFVYENAGKAARWTRHTIHRGREPLAFGFMFAFGDLDADGRLDLVASTGPRWEGRDAIHWFEQPADLSGRWKPHFLGGIHPDRSTGLELVDLDGDGKLDLFVGAYSWEPWDREPAEPDPGDASGRLAWFQSGDDPRAQWARHDLSRRRRGMFDLFVPRDLNGDGRIDLLTTRGNSGHYDGVIWLEQIRTESPGPAFRPARENDSPELALP